MAQTPPTSPLETVPSPAFAAATPAQAARMPAADTHVVALTPPSATSTEQETDVCYLPYAGKQMLPGFVVCILVTIAGLAAVWQLEGAFAPPRQSLLATAILLLVGGAWLFQLLRFGYRKLCTSIRITTRRVVWYRGFLYGGATIVPFSAVTRVELTANPINRMLGVGDVALMLEGPSAAPVVLLGVPDSDGLITALRQLIEKSRQGSVSATRVGLQSSVISALSGH